MYTMCVVSKSLLVLPSGLRHRYGMQRGDKGVRAAKTFQRTMPLENSQLDLELCIA